MKKVSNLTFRSFSVHKQNKMKTEKINDFKKCPSVFREGNYFLHSAENKLWIVQNPLSGCWFFERETDKTPSGKQVSRVYFRTSKIALNWFLENEIIW